MMKRDLKVKVLFFSLISASVFGAENSTDKLWDAVKKGQYIKVRSLIKKGADIDARQERNLETPLILAARLEKTVPYQKETNFFQKRTSADKKMALVTKKLLLFGANPVAQDMWGMTPLMWAARNDALEVLKILLQRREIKENINIQDKKGNTALIHAVRDSGDVTPEDFIQVVKELLLNGADPNIKNSLKKSALQYAISTDQLAIIGLLLAFGAKVTTDTMQEITEAAEKVITGTSNKTRQQGGPSTKHPYVGRTRPY